MYQRIKIFLSVLYLGCTVAFSGCGNGSSPTSSSSPEVLRTSNGVFSVKFKEGIDHFIRSEPINLDENLPPTIQLADNALRGKTFNRCVITVVVSHNGRSRLNYLVSNECRLVDMSANYVEVEIPWNLVKDTIRENVSDDPSMDYSYVNLNIGLMNSGVSDPSGIIVLPLRGASIRIQTS